MARKLFSIRGGITIAVAFLAAATLLWIASAKTNGSTAKDVVQWNDKSSKDLAAALHHMHEVANSGDTKALKQLLIGDDVLVTFELASDNMTPVPLRSKTEIDTFIDRVNEGASAEQGTFTLDMPKMNCRATDTFGVCTEECTVHFKMADGTERIDHLFGTATGVKTADGWKWVQWHMSVGGKPENVKVATTSTSHGH
jgi:SnoaL-like domain